MASIMMEKDMPIIQQHWNNFISLVKEDLNSLSFEQRNIVIEIKKYERIGKILQYGDNNIDFLLAHKESILAIDKDLEQKFSILEAFKKIGNLENAVAIRTYNEILASDKLKDYLEVIAKLTDKKEELQNQIDMVSDLIYGISYNKDLIEKLCKNHGLGVDEIRAIKIYPLIKTLKQARQLTSKKTITQEEVLDTQVGLEEPLEEIETLTDIDIKIPTYQDEFAKYKDKYDMLKDQTNLVLNKYYVILSEMTPTEMQYYRIYCSLSEEELKTADLNASNYDEAMAKIIAIRLFDAKGEIEKIIKNIQANEYKDKDEIEYLAAYIEEFENLSNKLTTLDDKIVKIGKEKPIEEVEPQKVFFLIDQTMRPIIPDVIKERGYQSSLTSIFDKAQAGFIQQKKGSNIMPLKIHDKKFKDECGRTVFAVRNAKVIVSYIKLNSNTGISNDGGIMILTASLLSPNTIQEDTDKVIKEYGSQILSQIAAIEREDIEQLTLQAAIREEYAKSVESLGGR